MIFIIFSILLNFFLYYLFYIYYGFIITNAIMVILKTIDFKYRNILYIKLKNNKYINEKLLYLEKIDHEMKLKFMTFLFSYLQQNIIPIITNIEETSKEEPKKIYSSDVFKNENDEVNFLNKLEKNLL